MELKATFQFWLPYFSVRRATAACSFWIFSSARGRLPFFFSAFVKSLRDIWLSAELLESVAELVEEEAELELELELVESFEEFALADELVALSAELDLASLLADDLLDDLATFSVLLELEDVSELEVEWLPQLAKVNGKTAKIAIDAIFFMVKILPRIDEFSANNLVNSSILKQNCKVRKSLI